MGWFCEPFNTSLPGSCGQNENIGNQRFSVVSTIRGMCTNLQLQHKSEVFIKYILRVADVKRQTKILEYLSPCDDLGWDGEFQLVGV